YRGSYAAPAPVFRGNLPAPAAAPAYRGSYSAPAPAFHSGSVAPAFHASPGGFTGGAFHGGGGGGGGGRGHR
ncbi:MAG: peptide-binding protein, partial [Myxococcota bacterium]|nr:peptide-binding protein [Myxococcota bacterium]